MPEIVNKKSVLDMAMGAIAEITDYEVNRVVANIMAPVQPVRTALCITKGRDGALLLAEMTPQVPGQVDMDGAESPEPAIARVGRAGY